MLLRLWLFCVCVAFAVEMMQSEMELVESIKQNEESVDAVNGRVERFKVSVVGE